MERHEKIRLLKDIAAGKAAIDQLKPQINVHRLTIAELYLILNIYNRMKREGRKILSEHEKECLDYYTTEANNRPITEREKRGFSIMRDVEMIIVRRSDDKVKEWYQILKLNERLYKLDI